VSYINGPNFFPESCVQLFAYQRANRLISLKIIKYLLNSLPYKVKLYVVKYIKKKSTFYYFTNKGVNASNK